MLNLIALSMSNVDDTVHELCMTAMHVNIIHRQSILKIQHLQAIGPRCCNADVLISQKQPGPVKYDMHLEKSPARCTTVT